MAEAKKQSSVEAPLLESEKPVFTWKAPEFAQYSKNNLWFFVVIVAGLIVAGIFVWLKNWAAVAVVVAALVALLSQSRAKPKSVNCTIYRQGIVLNEKAYAYSEFKSFWIIYGEHPKIRLEPAKRFAAVVNIPISDEEPEQVRLFLSKYLPMDENKGEDIADTIQRWIKF